MNRSLTPTLFHFVTLSAALCFVQTASYAQARPDAAAALQMVRTALANASAQMPDASGTPAMSGQQPLGPKKAGVKRLGIVMPKSDMGYDAGPMAGEPLREMESQFLTGPTFEIVKIAALLPAQAYAEAKASECDYVLLSSVSQRKISSGFGGLKTLSTMAPMASMIPGVGMAAAMASMAATTGLAAASSAASSNIKAKSEVTLEYSLRLPDGTAVLSDAQKARTKRDGEDVLTPLVQNAAIKVTGLLSQ